MTKQSSKTAVSIRIDSVMEKDLTLLSAYLKVSKISLYEEALERLFYFKYKDELDHTRRMATDADYRRYHSY